MTKENIGAIFKNVDVSTPSKRVLTNKKEYEGRELGTWEKKCWMTVRSGF